MEDRGKKKITKESAIKEKGKRPSMKNEAGKKSAGGSINKSSAKRIDSRKLRMDIEKKAKIVSDRDISELIDREDEIVEKLRTVPAAFGKLINQLKLLYEMARDFRKGEYRAIPWYAIGMAVAGLLYFINPFDILFDIIPVIGYIDDALVIGLVIKAIKEDLKKYCAFKGYNEKMYF